MNAISPVSAYEWPQGRGLLVGKAWDDLFLWAHRNEMSDLHLQTNRPVKMVVHGRFYDVTRRPLTPEEVNNATQVVYGPTALAHLKTARDFDKAHVVEERVGDRYRINSLDSTALVSQQHRFRFRVNGTPIMTYGKDGVQLTLRRIEQYPPKLETLDLEPQILQAHRPRTGLVLICGAVGTGKTRLLAGITRGLLEDPAFHGKIIELAAPLEYEFDQIDGRGLYSPTEIPTHLQTPLSGMVGALRRAFHVLVSLECRDRETMEVAMMAAQTGALVYSTLHTNSVVETIQRILALFPREEREDRAISLAQSLRMVVNCLLVPSTDGKRTQLREYLVFGPREREALLDSPVSIWPKLTRQLINEQGQTFSNAAEIAFTEGRISEEVAVQVKESF